MDFPLEATLRDAARLQPAVPSLVFEISDLMIIHFS